MQRSFTVLVLLVWCVVSVGCGGGGNSGNIPPIDTTPPTTVGGVVFASTAVTSGVVEAYDFSNGGKGSLVTSGPINADGSYQLVISASPSVLLLEARSLCYREIAYYRAATLGAVEDAFLKRDEAHCPYSNTLSTVVLGSSSNAHITPFTHAAWGLAQYRLAQGDTVATAVATANNAISALVGTNILNTLPMPPNASATGTPGELYGSLSGGVSSWLLNIAMVANAAPNSAFGISPYSTTAMAELMRNDLAYDGLLNGTGTVSGSVAALSVGVVPLNANFYRHEIASYAITRVRGDLALERRSNIALPYLPGVVAYNDRTDALYAGATSITLDEGGPVIFLSNQNGDTGSSNYPVAAWARDIVGFPLDGGKLYVDSVYYDTCNQPDNCQSTINTTIFPNGWHLVEFRSTNLLGHQSSVSASVNFSN